MKKTSETNFINIEKRYWKGRKTLKNEVPWQVPASIYFMDHLCLPSSRVLEFGSGGSTLFFARRCEKVTSVETDVKWSKSVKDAIKEKEFDNIEYEVVATQKELELYAGSQGSEFTILSVDSVEGYDRSRILDAYLKKESRASNLQVIILDNYGQEILFPNHFNLSLPELISKLKLESKGVKWKGIDFDDSHWWGNGTRILYRA